MKSNIAIKQGGIMTNKIKEKAERAGNW